jgi:hypothetical protein
MKKPLMQVTAFTVSTRQPALLLLLRLKSQLLLLLLLQLLLLLLSAEHAQANLLNYRQIVSSREGLCWQSGSAGQQITIQKCSPLAANQFWAITPIGLNQFRILSSDGLCVDLLNRSTALGAPLGVWPCNPDPNAAKNQVFTASTFGPSFS